MGSLSKEPSDIGVTKVRSVEGESSIPKESPFPKAIRIDATVSKFVEACDKIEEQYAIHGDDIKEAMTEFEKQVDEFTEALNVLALKYYVPTTNLKAAATRGNAKADVSINLGEYIRSECTKYVMGSVFARRTLEKPRGYAGDYEMIRMVYNPELCVKEDTTFVGRFLDRLMIHSHAGTGVRLRRDLVTNVVTETLAKLREGSTDPRIPNVLSVGCGPCQEIFDVLKEAEKFSDNDSSAQPLLNFIGLDIDQEAIDKVRASIETLPETQKKIYQMILHKVNVIRLVHAHATGQSLRPQDAQLFDPLQDNVDIIYSLGLIDYFEDDQVVALLNWIHGLLLPVGGMAVIGNFAPVHSLRGFLDYVVDWRLICRTESELINLCQKSICAQDCQFHVLKMDGNDAQLFLMVQRNPPQ